METNHWEETCGIKKGEKHREEKCGIRLGKKKRRNTRHKHRKENPGSSKMGKTNRKKIREDTNKEKNLGRIMCVPIIYRYTYAHVEGSKTKYRWAGC